MERSHHKKKTSRRSRSPSSSKKSKRSKRKERSPSVSNSDSDSNHETRSSRLPKAFPKELDKDTISRQKELIKATETAEEKRKRRLMKKETKERKRRKDMGWDDEYLGYTNTNNPFGDHNLLENFTWKKKLEKEGIKDPNSYEHRQRLKMKQQDMKRELEKVKKSRLEREQLKAARDEEMAMMQREKESALFEEWEKQEDDFHLSQAKMRSQIRIKDGRAKPIDLLAAYINPKQEDIEMQMHEPYSALVGLNIDDLEDLVEDIKVYLELEEGRNAQFWHDMTTIAKAELGKLKRQREHEALSSRRDVINSAVKSDISAILKGKTYSQLAALQKQIQEKLNIGGAIDTGYWESLLQELKSYMAKARLKEQHQQLLKQKLDGLRNESNDTEDEDNGSDDNNSVIQHNSPAVNSPLVKIETHSDTEETTLAVDDVQKSSTPGEKSTEDQPTASTADQRLEPPKTDEELAAEAYDIYNKECYSPRLIASGDVDQAKWILPEVEIEQLEYYREQIRCGAEVEENDIAGKLFTSESGRGMKEDEEAFNVPVDIAKKKYNWSDKYRPRKPRFFNRVHTGYEWNKYNQTHYDTENPPPKVVQGYKFNIFYPDLIDKTATPEFHVTPCKDNKDFAILKFSAGPPYEDIAFKIVNREFEYSHKHGYRCQFQNNIFQMWFHFKRYRYRR